MTQYQLPYAQIYPCIGLQVHGLIGKGQRKSDPTPHGWWIHKEYKRYKVVAKYYYPTNPKTGKQQSWRTVFRDAVSGWQGFDQPTRHFYNQLQRPTNMSGYNRYLGFYLNANYPPVAYDFLLLETEDKLLQEISDGIILEYYYLLLETGDLLLLETGDKIKGQ